MGDRGTIDMAELEGLSTKLFPKGDIIFEKGDAPDCAYLIRSGKVNIVARRGTMDVVLNTLSRGDFFGEMALVDDQPRSARAVVEEEAECAVFTQKEINESLAKSDLLTYALLRLLTKRIRKSTLRGE